MSLGFGAVDNVAHVNEARPIKPVVASPAVRVDGGFQFQFAPNEVMEFRAEQSAMTASLTRPMRPSRLCGLRLTLLRSLARLTLGVSC